MVDESDKEGVSRRELVKIGLVIGGGAAAIAAGTTLLGPFFRGPAESSTMLIYESRPGDQWWNDREGQPIRVTDFQEWQGATGRWLSGTRDGKPDPHTGYPVLVVRVKRDDSVFKAPAPGEVSLPSGFGLYYDDSARDIRIVAFYDRCSHLGCFPGWQMVQNPPPSRDYVSDAPTYQIYGVDPVYCVCHGSQFDPMILASDVNPENGVSYVGPSRVHGPASRTIPIVPLKAVDDILVGGMPDPRWYPND